MRVSKPVALVVAWAAIGMACTSAIRSVRASDPPADGALTAAHFQHEVVPFEVLGADGKPYAFPFLGGLDVPRPQFVDIDGDGDLDLFVQENANALKFFENVGSRRAPRYVWRSDKYQGLDTGEWARFVDLDGDGAPDLLTELPFSYIRRWSNAGTRSEPRFVPGDTLRDVEGRPIPFDRQNIPAFADVDCDGRVDLLAGRVEGTVARYEQVEPGDPRFVLQDEFWEGIEIVAVIDTTARPSGPSPEDRPTRHGANALAVADFDGDGDVDLFWGDFFERGVLLIENVGRTCGTPDFRTEPVWVPFAEGLLTSGYNAPAPVDYDGDGDLDFLMGVLGGTANPVRTAADNFYHWERTGPQRYDLRSTRFLDGLDVGSESAPALVDLDGDGLLDLVVGSKVDPRSTQFGRLYLHRNIGTATAPRFAAADTMFMGEYYNLAPAFGDLDGDGDEDLLLGTWNQDIVGFRNLGTRSAPRFVRDTSFDAKLERVSNAIPVLADVDYDQDLDLLVGQANGELQYYRNDGGHKQPRWVLAARRFEDIDVGRRSAPFFFDVDGDKLPDLLSGREEGGLLVYRNTGTRSEPRFVADPALQLALPLPPMSVPVLADLNGDGRPDLISGTAAGGLVFYRGVMPPR